MLVSLTYSKFQQYLLDFTKVCQENCVYIYIHAHTSTTKNLNYLIIRFSRYFFLFLTQYLILYKSYTLRFRQNLYYSFESTLKSLRSFIIYAFFFLSSFFTLPYIFKLISHLKATNSFLLVIASIRLLSLLIYLTLAISYLLYNWYKHIILIIRLFSYIVPSLIRHL